MKKNILLIDDNIDSLNVTEEIIHTYMDDVNVFTALSGKEGIKLVVKHKMDVILLDLNMPNMNGIEVCQKLREMDETQYTPIVFFTGMDTDSAVRSRALAVGGDEFISKPIQVAELIARINAMLRIKRMRDKMEEEKKEVETNLAYMKILWEFSSEILKMTNLHELADKITQSGVNLTEASGGFINIYDNIDNKFENISLFIKNHNKEYVNSFEDLKFVKFKGLSSLVVDDVKLYCRKNNIKEEKLPFANMIIIPLISKRFIFGVLVLFDKENGFVEKDMMKMETFSNFASGVLYNLYSSQKHLAIYEKRYESLFNLIDIPLFIIDSKGEFIDLNDAFAKVFGCKNKYELDENNFYDMIMDKSDVGFIKKGLELKDNVKGIRVKLKTPEGGAIDVILNIGKEDMIGGEQYYLKGSISNFKGMNETEKDAEFFKRVNEFYTITDREFFKTENSKKIYQNCADIIRKIFNFKSVLIALFNEDYSSYKTIGYSSAEGNNVGYDIDNDILKKIRKGDKNIYKFQGFSEDENIITPLKDRNSGDVKGFISIKYSGEIRDRGTVFESIMTFGDKLMTELDRHYLKENIEFYNPLIDVVLNERDSAILVIDNYFKIKFANEIFLKIVKKNNFKGKHCYELMHGINSPVEFCPLLKSYDIKLNGKRKEERYFEPLLNRDVVEIISPVIGNTGILGYILEFR